MHFPFPSHIGPEDVRAHSRNTKAAVDISAVSHDLILAFVEGYVAVTAHDDERKQKEAWQLMTDIDRCFMDLQERVNESKRDCVAVLKGSRADGNI